MEQTYCTVEEALEGLRAGRIIVTIDGISLTVASVEPDRFSVSIIPHTAAVTILGQKRVGDIVNLETDIIGKYVEKLLCPQQETQQQSKITLKFLASNGF